MASDQVNPPVLPLQFRRDERARAAFLGALRRHVFEDLALVMRRDYFAHLQDEQHEAEDIHRLMQRRSSFRFYSALRVGSQDLLYQTVRTPVERSRFAASSRRLGSLHLDANLPVPRSVSAIDVHLMPGSYTAEYAADDLSMGAVYDARLRISTFGVFGPDLDDIGHSMAHYLQQRLPGWAPRRMLDLGCTVGHNTLPWKTHFPKLQLHGIDVAAPCLRYAHQRARRLGVAAHFWQMDASRLDFPDAHFDLVFSSMFLHEVPRRSIPQVLKEAFRVLRPGGIMLHMELPPASAVAPYDSFYLDWDGRYNNEPYYRAFRALDPRTEVERAGFAAADFFEEVVPSWYGSLRKPRSTGVDAAPGDVGRLARGVRWYAFGARK